MKIQGATGIRTVATPAVRNAVTAIPTLGDELVIKLSSQGAYSPASDLTEKLLSTLQVDVDQRVYAEGNARLMYLEALQEWFSQKAMIHVTDTALAEKLLKMADLLGGEFKQCQHWLSHMKGTANE